MFGTPKSLCVRGAMIVLMASVLPSLPAVAATPEVKSSRAVAFAVTPPVTELANLPLKHRADKNGPILPPKGEINKGNRRQIKRTIPGAGAGQFERFIDGALPDSAREGAEVMPAPISFPGISVITPNVLPPDTVGDVGPNHYVQSTNAMPTTAQTAVAIYNKTTGALSVPIFPLANLFSTLGASPCNGGGDGDPIVLYDSFADRWIISEFEIDSNPGHQCIAISQTGDPTGTWYAYDFVNPNNRFVDYPHYGVWGDAYYMTANEFNNPPSSFLGAGVFAFERAKMIAGDPTASLLYFHLAVGTFDAGGLLPSDADGVAPPPTGLPQRMYEFRSDEFGSTDSLRIYEFVPNFVTPASSTFTALVPDLPLAAFDARQPSANAVEQFGSIGLDSIADRLMHRIQYRNVGTLAAPINRWTGNFTVNVSGVNPTAAALYQAAPRWFILGSGGVAVPTVLDQGTHIPDAINGATGNNRWMGSAALDNQGNLAIGFSRASSTVRADMLIAGRLAGDAAGSLVQGEVVVHAAAGVQTHASGRWGDYSSMNVDPADDCTFWYTTEFYAANGPAIWQTRIGHLVYPTCVAPARGTVAVNVTNCATAAPIPNATVTMTGGFQDNTDAAGDLLSDFVAGPGSYTVSASEPGWTAGAGSTAPAVVVNAATTNVNVCLDGLAAVAAENDTLVSEVCTNSALDPGELVTVSLCVEDVGTGPTTNLVGTLQATGGVTSPSGPQNFGAIAPGAAVCRDFSWTVDGAATCGGAVIASLQLQDGATNFGNVTYGFVTGTPTGAAATNTFSYTGPAVAITDNLPAGMNVNLPVAGIPVDALITDVNFRFDVGAGTCDQTVGDVDAGLDHTWVGDVRVQVTSPSAQSAVVIDQIGVPASQFGLNAENFCLTTLDDEGGFPAIEATILDPVTGNFSPNNPLSALDATTIRNGNWVVNVSDRAVGDAGSLRRFSLIISTVVQQCQVGPSCSTTPVDLLDFGVDGRGKR